jgi:hypothetical protein
MFQLFAGKQVFGVAAVLGNLAKQKDFAHFGTQPSCTTCKETTSHLLLCQEEGRVKCVNQQLKLLSDWLYSCGTNPELAEVLSEFLYAKGEAHHHGFTLSRRHQYEEFLHSQERIGWVKTMEGMISEELLQLDRQAILDDDCRLTVDAWA